MGNFNKREDSSKIDDDLYSRQIICLGIDTMKKISQLKILIIGLRGLGVEIAKNIIVSGPKIVTVFDPVKVEINDLGSNFYLSEKDIGKRRDESCLDKLKKLNKYVIVNYLKEKNINDLFTKLQGNFNVIILTEIFPQKDIIQLDNISRNNKICFIYSAICGLCSFIFTDFGKKFTIYDEYCIKKRKFYLKKIEKSKEGLVEIQWTGKGNPNIQEYIKFKEVEGMTELNYDEKKKNIYKIKSKDETSFYIGDTSNFSEYITGGYIEETTSEQEMTYQCFQDTLDEPFIDDNSYKNHKKKFIFLIFKALMIFFDRKNRLPLKENKSDYEEIKNITKTLYEKINFENSKSFEKDELIFDEKLILNICSTSRAEIPCMTSIIGGIVSQEILKITGKFKPINQWEIINFSQYSSIIPEKDKIFQNVKKKKIRNRYEDLISVFGEKIVKMIQNLNIFLAGAGAVGCELLKNISLLGIPSGLVIDDDNIEISNLNRQFLFQEEHKGKSKAFIASKSAKEINPDCNFKYLSKRISPENKYIFKNSYFNKFDFVLGAIDSSQGNYYLSRQCELYEKILIKGATGGPCGKVQTFIPKKTGSYNDIPDMPDEEDQEKLPSCTRREFPGKIEDCIDNARDLFDDYYVTIVDDILKLFEPKGKFLELEVNMSMDKFNLIKNYFYLIKNEFNRKKIIKNNNEEKSKFNFFKIKKNSINNNMEKEFIKFGLMEFEKLFVSKIKNIYISHPINDTEESKSFWANKRKPFELLFNINDELSFAFLFNFLFICSKLLAIPFENNLIKFKQKLNEVINEINSSKNVENEALIYINDPHILYNKIINEIKNIQKDSELLDMINSLQKINFEKDIPELGHVQFIHSYSNLKAKTYKIPQCNKYYSLEYVGKIAPTTITSTAAVAGIMCLQMIGIIINQLYIWPQNKIIEVNEDEFDEELKETGLHNFFFDLKINEYDFECLSELEYSEYKGSSNLNKLIPTKYSSWFKLIEKGNQTVKEFIDYIKEKFGIDITLILSAEDDRNIYEKIPPKKKSKKLQEKRRLMENILNQNIDDVYYNTAKNICNEYEKENELYLKVKGIDKNGTYVEAPIIKYIIQK